jgi:hypothetical protein
METKDWEFCVVEYENRFKYYAQHKEVRMPCEQIIQSDLTETEAVAMLSLIDEPVKLQPSYYFVNIEK